MKKTYLESRTLSDAAEKLGLTRKTLAKYLHKEGIVMHPGRKKGKQPPNKGYHHGCLAMYLRLHPAIILPKSPIRIAKLSGCTQDEVKSYLYRRRYSTREKIKKIPWTKGVGAAFDSFGDPFPLQGIKHVETITIDKFTFEGTITLILKDNSKRIIKESHIRLKQMFSDGS